ncbi:hypothetical protein HW555_006057 [Spodoptera exigua]|uniref:Uncharacterized protein n=1 Tax=Spodoptera exigua TaxID=7107 RepID=A0A835LAF8_SPOEX|nr:hypothetical protein HW555_006057 [Spodoptera exigua]
MLALKTFHRGDIEKIQELVVTKTVEETRAAVEYYTEIALQHPAFLQKEQEIKPKLGRKPTTPINRWAKLLTDNLKLEELRTETATAVRMIADLENIPPAVCTDNIDFREVYRQIANAMEGKPIVLDVSTASVFHKCLLETALSSKAFIKTAAFKYFINNIDLSDKEINTFPRPTEKHELAILRHLASQRAYNPLNVPEENLKPFCDMVSNDNKAQLDNL